MSEDLLASLGQLYHGDFKDEFIMERFVLRLENVNLLEGERYTLKMV